MPEKDNTDMINKLIFWEVQYMQCALFLFVLSYCSTADVDQDLQSGCHHGTELMGDNIISTALIPTAETPGFRDQIPIRIPI